MSDISGWIERLAEARQKNIQERLLPIGTLIREVCKDNFEVTWKITEISKHGTYTLEAFKKPDMEYINVWKCTYQKMDDLMKGKSPLGNKFIVIQQEHFTEDLFTL